MAFRDVPATIAKMEARLEKAKRVEAEKKAREERLARAREERLARAREERMTKAGEAEKDRFQYRSPPTPRHKPERDTYPDHKGWGGSRPAKKADQRFKSLNLEGSDNMNQEEYINPEMSETVKPVTTRTPRKKGLTITDVSKMDGPKVVQ